MLNLYYGRENLDKDRFLFEHIGEKLKLINNIRKIILLVPDQFTLQAEKNAFTYLKMPGLMDLEVISQSRLVYRVLAETGGSRRVHIDKHGRHMLISKILSDENQDLEVFKGMHQKHSFIDMTNNLISEMKQYNTSPKDLPDIINVTDEKSILHRKLTDIHKIYTKYEELIKDKYVDTEDYLNLCISRINQSELIRNSEIWVYGFDYFTPKSLDIMEQLIKTAIDVNVILSADKEKNDDKSERDSELFDLTRALIYKLTTAAEKNGILCHTEKIKEAYIIPVGSGIEEKALALAHLEHELYAYPSIASKECDGITLCRAANFYAEAETAAARIVQLVRDERLRYREIVVICNDMETRASIVKRVFEEYGISAFLDKKRDILHHPAFEFLDSLIHISAKGWLYEDVFRLLKTNLTPITPDDWEDLENYIIKYRIKGNRWKSDFKYGIKEEGEEGLAKLNQIRKQVSEYITAFESKFNGAKTVKEKTNELYCFLRDHAQLPEKLEGLIDDLLYGNKFEYAEETAQIWGVIAGIFDQLTELIGEEKLTSEEYGNILKSGLEAVEIGLLPPTLDQVIVGTMQRTRISNIKALLVIGANDGLLPAAVAAEGLLSEDEKAALLRKNIEICKIDQLRVKEETLAIYKTLSKPTKHLWISYSASDIEGNEIKQSFIFDRIRKIFNDAELKRDIINEEASIARIETPNSTLKHLTEAFRNSLEGKSIESEWKSVYRWYQTNRNSQLKRIEEGLFYTNKQNYLNHELIRKMYKKDGNEDYVISPSRLERFSRCPFSHFIAYGLKPEERRIFEIAGREIGDVYHQCIMKLSDQLTVPGIEITAPESPWMKVTKEECRRIIHSLIDEESSGYKEGVLIQGQEEKYRAERMKEVCSNAAWALVEHVQKGQIQKVYFEIEFGKAPEKQLSPIEVKLSDFSIFIEGKIDRVDILNDQYVKIIDYKSGKEKFDTDEAKGGWKLQLMLYLKAATGQKAGGIQKLKPAGVFYFEIAEPQVDATDFTDIDYQEKIKSEIKKNFKLDGIILDNPDIIESIAGEFSGYSDIIPVKKNKDGLISGTTDKKLLNEEDFAVLQKAVDRTIEDLCSRLFRGSIEIRPKRIKQETACRFCLYKSICCFDQAFEGCSYEIVK